MSINAIMIKLWKKRNLKIKIIGYACIVLIWILAKLMIVVDVKYRVKNMNNNKIIIINEFYVYEYTNKLI